MTEDELRRIVRDAVARHLGAPAEAVGRPQPLRWHPSHLRLPVASGDELDGPCLIEPAVRCNHCGFCQSLGH
jgi:hypothetical protein